MGNDDDDQDEDQDGATSLGSDGRHAVKGEIKLQIVGPSLVVWRW